MPTYNRRKFVPLAIRYFLRQDYPNRELIIIDDGTDNIGDLVPDDPQVRYLRLGHKRTIGAKRNLACEEAKGPIIVHWDDDDWYAPRRISYQVRTLTEEQADICGLSKLFFYDPLANRSWQYVYPQGSKPWLAGGTLCYRKSIWQNSPFPDIDVGEDGQFLWSHPLKKMVALEDLSFYVAIKHPENTSPKQVTGDLWHSYPAEKIQTTIGNDLHVYASLQLGSTQQELTSATIATHSQDDRQARSTASGREKGSYTYDVIMVVHNACEVVKMSTLQTLKHCDGQSARLTVVDNMSTDGAEEWLNFLARRNDINLIRCKTNLGHGPGIELARQRTSAPYIVTLDSDAFPLHDDWLRQLRARLKGTTKVAGIRHHRNYIHPACLMVARKTLEDFGLTFLDEKNQPSQLDVAERISHELARRGYDISGLERTDAQCRGSAAEPIYLGSCYEGLVYHQWYTTRTINSSCQHVDDVPRETIERSIDSALERCYAEARDVTVVMGIRANLDEPHRLRNVRASLWSFTAQDLPRWRYTIIVVEQNAQPQLESELAPFVDRYVFAHNPGPYNRSWAFNVGASLNPGRDGVLCLTDADLVVPPDFLRRGWEAFESGQSAFLPYSEIVYLNPKATDDTIRDCCDKLPRPRQLDNCSGDVFATSQGGCIWVNADLYHRIGGHDERFRGWGYEDREFFDRLVRSAGVKRLQGRLLHLYHPPAVVDDCCATANRQLYEQISAGQNPRPMGPLGDINLYSRQERSTDGPEDMPLQRRDWQNWHRWNIQRIEQIVRDEQYCPVQKSARRRLAEILVQLGDSLLDIGCGPGALWPHLEAYRPHFSWTGVDITREMLQTAHRLFPEVPLHHADAGSLPFDTDGFDLALLRHVLEHLPPDLMRLSLKEAMRVARRAVILDFYAPPIVGGDRQTRRVGDNFLETRWATVDIETPVNVQGWKLETRCFIANREGGEDEVWVLIPSHEADAYKAHKETLSTLGKSKISIIMPTYQRHHTILRTIATIRRQTYKNWELLIIDNAGDTSYEFRDPRIRVYRHCAKTSASYARNLGLAHVSGDLVCFFDDDDDMFPQYLERFARVFCEHPNAKMARCGMAVARERTDYSYATPECCLRREFATPTWLPEDGQKHDQAYFSRIVSRNKWSQEAGDVIMIHEALCKANFDPRGGLRGGNY